MTDDIPASPAQTYADSGWVGMRDWLGTAGKRPLKDSWLTSGQLFLNRMSLRRRSVHARSLLGLAVLASSIRALLRQPRSHA